MEVEMLVTRRKIVVGMQDKKKDTDVKAELLLLFDSNIDNKQGESSYWGALCVMINSGVAM